MSARRVYNALNKGGVFCIFKPKGISVQHCVRKIKFNLAQGLNHMYNDEPLKERVQIDEDNIGTDLPVVTTVPDLAASSLVLGPMYQPEDFRVHYCGELGSFASGVTVLGIGEGCKLVKKILDARYIHVYHVKGTLGRATDNFAPDGHLVEKTTWNHVKRPTIDRILAASQALHQRQMFLNMRVDPQSQEAYDIAAKGLIRPEDGYTAPIIYNMKCIEFQPPDFTVEVHCVNEHSKYLRQITHNVGLEAKSTAICTQIRRIRYGHFTLSHALLDKHWTVEHILSNIKHCKSLTKRSLLKPGPNMIQLEHRDTSALEPGDRDTPSLDPGCFDAEKRLENVPQDQEIIKNKR
ncbi:unnamed protein product [Owenia fusiformis]|uniref:Uncharacterized protein n=1 Tax=Owenia fusiformis TaxID=6347 RepID=A0A8J1U1C5_OWEFU|nr:unnamed protein product [Owenia fusiformis]